MATIAQWQSRSGEGEEHDEHKECTETLAARFIRMVRERAWHNATPFRLQEVRAIMRQWSREELAQLMDEIGSYPSSEPELRALQAEWDPRA